MSWQEKDTILEKEFLFKTFQDALTFINRVGEIAESIEHHPDIFLYSYNHVRITSTTHDRGDLSDKDYDLIERIDAIKI